MTEQQPVVSETTLGYEIFRPLWAMVVLGAVASVQSKPLQETTLVEYVTSQRSNLDRLLGTIRAVGDFSTETMAIFEEQGGWRSDHVVTIDELSMDMVMYSGFIEEYPPDVHDSAVVRRLLDAGTDLQLANFMNALVDTAMARGPGLESSSALIIDAVRMAGSLLGIHRGSLASDAFRLWRVAFLQNVLLPDSIAPENTRKDLRKYVRVLGNIVVS